jgi:hypothetical protein
MQIYSIEKEVSWQKITVSKEVLAEITMMNNTALKAK